MGLETKVSGPICFRGDAMRGDRAKQLKRAASMFDKGCGYKSVATRLGVPKETVLKWAYTYRALGREALFVTEHRKYDHETKVRAARAVAEGEMTKPEAMEAFGLRSKTQIDTWCRLYREGGPDALLPKPKGRPKKVESAFSSREEELEARVQELELENEILKRFNALAEEIEQRRQIR